MSDDASHDEQSLPANPTPLISRIYSAPRRFDLATMFVVSFAFALMFGVFRVAEMRAEGTIVVSVFIATVGTAQALLFKGKRPRLASVLTGAVAFVLLLVISNAVFGVSTVSPIELLFVGIFGSIWGYLAGCLVGVVFMTAELCRWVANRVLNSDHSD